ncbi:MAG: FAD-binding protein [Clostridiales bacterium]|nr:FAD-binding protein [Clostridiales bacterium]
MYNEAMLEAIKEVEKTRAKRLDEEFARLTADEKLDLLHNYHPDFRDDTQRELRVGANKGDKIPCEIADLLEAKSLLNPKSFDITKIEYDVDVLIIGAGGAGSSAALVAKENGAKVLMVTKLRHGDSNTVMAQGGIQAADKTNDSPTTHYLDVVGGGGYTNVPELAKALTMDAPSTIKWLESLGCMFSKDEDGTMQTIHGGGTSRKRMHFASDYTGAEIMRTLRDEVQNKEIETIEFCSAVELLLDEDGKCGGAVLYNMETKEYFIARAKTVVIATGGSGRLHLAGFPTSNHYGATADGIVMAYRVGAKLAFLDANQVHPTGVVYPKQMIGQLVTEKVRGIGAQLVNTKGKQFIHPLETRDVVSSAVIRECEHRQNGYEIEKEQYAVWLDSPMIDLIHGKGTVKRELPAMYKQYERYNIDMSKHPILIFPTLHYQNGGILIGEVGQTEIENLFVAGEVAGGVHGRNRLMGNSLLDILVFGLRAGKAAAEKSKKSDVKGLSLKHVENYHKQMLEARIDTERVSPMILPDYTDKK